MASIQDTLELILKVTELNTVLQAFNLISSAVGEVEQAFIGYEAQVVRTQFFLEKFGHSLPTGELQAFISQLSTATGQTQSDIAAAASSMARFSSAGVNMEKNLKDVANAALAANVPMEDFAHLIERAMEGHGRGLWSALGIQIKGMEGQLYSFSQVMDMVNQHTAGFSEQFSNTLPGALLKTKAAFDDMLIALGELLSPAILAFSEHLADIFKSIADFARTAAASFGIVAPDMAGAAGAAGGGGRSRVEDYLQQITTNTGPQGPLGRALLGGGSFSQPGGGLVIRDFNTMFRGGTGSR